MFSSMFGSPQTPYYSIQLSVMNALHCRGDSTDGGTVLRIVVTGKIKSIIKPYVTGAAARHLKEVHLHVDKPTKIIVQKRSERSRRDQNRSNSTDGWKAHM